MKTLNNKQFLSIMKSCCENGHIDDKVFNLVLSNYWPYNLVFKRDFERSNGR